MTRPTTELPFVDQTKLTEPLSISLLERQGEQPTVVTYLPVSTNENPRNHDPRSEIDREMKYT